MLRRRSIRMRIIVLVLVPVIALIGLYGVALSLTLSSYLSLRQAADVRNAVTNPVTDVQLQLSAERALALRYLANPTHARLLALLGQEPKSDLAISAFLGMATRAAGEAGPGERQATRTWTANLATLHGLRAATVSVSLSRAGAAESYSGLIAGADYVLTQVVLPVLDTSALIQANDLLTMEESLQAVAEERDLFTADLGTRSYPAADARLVSQLIVAHRELWNQARSGLGQQFREYFATDIQAWASKSLAGLENQILAGPRSAMQVPAQEWISVNTVYAAGFRKALRSASNDLHARGLAQAREVLLRLILIGGLGLCAIVAAIAVAIRLSRALLQQLDELRLSALELSSVRLPVVLARLRSGEEVDVAAETPQLDPGPSEIGQLGRAFNLAAQTAVTAAADEAEIRRGVNDVFRNLARRNQSLLNRQLELLDAMERRVHDPEELADLFRVDHLTTRMRRHAEGLLIVAGGSSGRIWRDPVAIVDVMRAAVAEIEDYTRIRVTSRSSSLVAGHVVADVIHMLAELVENATTFSPTNTPVRIEADNVAKGLIVEIEDRGLGMTGKQINEINNKLSDPPLLDLSGSEQLGLFIAGQLARRHDVKITMRSSAYGGITAVVLIPSSLVIDPGYDEPLTVVGLRELGGRPVPQLPGPAKLEAVGAENIGATGYLVDLETAAMSTTTTATQVGGPWHTVPEDKLPDEQVWAEIAPAEIAPSGIAPAGIASAEIAPAEIASVNPASADATAGADTGRADTVGADTGFAGLKGAGPWLIEAQSAGPTAARVGGQRGSHDPMSESTSVSAFTRRGGGSESPMLMLGPVAELPSPADDHPAAADDHPAAAADDAAGAPDQFGLRAEPGLADQSVGWPERHPDGGDGGSHSLPSRSAGTVSTTASTTFGTTNRSPDSSDRAGESDDRREDDADLSDYSFDDRNIGPALPYRADPLDQPYRPAAPVGGSVGWPDEAAGPASRPASGSRPTSAGGPASGSRPAGQYDLPRHARPAAADPASPSRRDARDARLPGRPDDQPGVSLGAPGAPGSRTSPSAPGSPGSPGPAEEAYATGTIPLLPKRQARIAPLSFGQGTSDTDNFAAVTEGQPPPADLDGLPVRVRQASLAPQLRDQPPAPQAHHYVAAPQPADRVPVAEPSPEAARSFMSALQQGWERGRSMAEQMREETDGEQL